MGKHRQEIQKAFNFATFGPSSNLVSHNKMGKEVASLSKLFRILKYKLYKPMSSIQRYITRLSFPPRICASNRQETFKSSRKFMHTKFFGLNSSFIYVNFGIKASFEKHIWKNHNLVTKITVISQEISCQNLALLLRYEGSRGKQDTLYRTSTAINAKSNGYISWISSISCCLTFEFVFNQKLSSVAASQRVYSQQLGGYYGVQAQ